MKSRRAESRWDKIERLTLERSVLPIFEKRGERNRLVDVGAGVGRYAKLFDKFFKEIVAIEPDPARISELKKIFKDSPKNIVPIEDFAENADLPSSSADAVLVIHLIQHITERSEDIILGKARDWLKRGGILVLCFTVESRVIKGCHIKWQDGNGNIERSSVPENLFELVVKNSLPNVLPIRKIKVEKVAGKLKDMGFKVIFKEEYALDAPNILVKILLALITLVPIDYQIEVLLKKLGLKGFFLDCCLVATKR